MTIMIAAFALLLNSRSTEAILHFAHTPPSKCAAAANAFCNGPSLARCAAAIAKEGGISKPLVPLFDTNPELSVDAWRCYSPSALNANRTAYDRIAKKGLLCTESKLAEIVEQCLHPLPQAELILLTDAASRTGAVCLDGSPGAVYTRPGAVKKAFHLHLEGGGWCFHDPPGLEEDVGCWYRAYGPPIESRTPPAYLGSSSMLAANYSTAPPRGFSYLTSADAVENPAMWNWSFAYLHYCDGASYVGNATAPGYLPGKPRSQPLFYRGARVLTAAIQHLLEHAGLGTAEDVVVSGTSAGGLGVYLNIDRIAALIHATNPRARVRGLASAGYFIETGSDFATEITALALEQNATPALNRQCVERALGEGRNATDCFFAQHAAEFIATPTFALQSRFDTWQLAHIAHTSAANVSGVEAYGKVIKGALAPLLAAAEVTSGSAPKHAVWLSSCETHGLAIVPFWTTQTQTIGNASKRYEWSTFEAWRRGEYDGVSRAFVDCAHLHCNPSC